MIYYYTCQRFHQTSSFSSSTTTFSTLLIKLLALLIFVVVPIHSESSFEPYVLNGGLVSAIAGSDYIIMASDTRLTDGGYEIFTREYLASRIWSVKSAFDDSHFLNDDGSLSMPPPSFEFPKQEENGHFSIKTKRNLSKQASYTIRTKTCPMLIASAGCASDCESLKRQIRSEMHAHVDWNHGSTTTLLTPSGVANLLSQTLYSRRSFPFYSFCILAGMDVQGRDTVTHDKSYQHPSRPWNVSAHVHVYDAIGSHERVSIASAGNGKEMLQPILDRLFATATVTTSTTTATTTNTTMSHGSTRLQRDNRAVHATQQRKGLTLQPPVETHVLCDCDTAEALLVKAYRSVAEREISVGDNVVVCVVRRKDHVHHREKDKEQEDDDDHVMFEVKVTRYPLKEH